MSRTKKDLTSIEPLHRPIRKSLFLRISIHKEPVGTDGIIKLLQSNKTGKKDGYARSFP